MTTDKIREDRVRRHLRKMGYCGYRLCKTPARSWLRKHYGAGYMIIDNYSNCVVSGAWPHEYADTLEHVEAWTWPSEPDQQSGVAAE